MTKHILRAAEFLRDLVARLVVEVRHLPGRVMVADLLTKAVARVVYHELLRLFDACRCQVVVPVQRRDGDRHFADRGEFTLYLGPSEASPGSVVRIGDVVALALGDEEVVHDGPEQRVALGGLHVPQALDVLDLGPAKLLEICQASSVACHSYPGGA